MGGNRILAETYGDDPLLYLYGRDCLGHLGSAPIDDPLVGAGEWLYYLHDGDGLVRHGADENGAIVGDWLFDPDGTVLEGPEGPVSHLICGGGL